MEQALGDDRTRKAPTSPHSVFLRWLKRAGAVLIVVGAIGVALALFGNHNGPPVGPVGTPVTRTVRAGGLSFEMHVTPGPYFLGEMLKANLSLTNHSRTTYSLNGPWPSVDNLCGGAIFVLMSGGHGGPQYHLPDSSTPFGFSCSLSMSTLAPGHTMTFQEFLPVSYSGKVTLQSGVDVVQSTGPDGKQSSADTTPLDGRWPSITMSVATATPSDRQITLQQEGMQVRVIAPRASLGHLSYLYQVTCNAAQGATASLEEGQWEPISGTVLHEPPNCGGSGDQVIQWSYEVTAPGYAIASGQAGSCLMSFLCLNTLFMDITGIPAGESFDSWIDTQLDTCRVFLAVIYLQCQR